VTDEPRPRRFLTIEQAAEELNVKPNQIRALLRAGELRGIQVGGRRYLA
jgi:excisionase family DNA binding protein